MPSRTATTTRVSRASRLVAALLAVLCCLAAVVVNVEAKGSFGSPRSFAGGYSRVGKMGWYSQNYRYRTYGMYWIYGGRYYRHGSTLPYGYDGPQNRLGTGAYNDNQARDVMCRRNVTFDPNTIATPFIDYNSTMTCFKQLYTAPGDPGNVYLEDLMLDRYQWRVSIEKYPTFALVVFPDKDIAVPDMNMTLRLRRLVYLPTSYEFAPDAAATEIDLSTLTWAPCTLESCADPAAAPAPNTFGRPSSRFIDNSRLVTSAVTAIYQGRLRITVRVWLSDDFAEDPFYEHVFLHPAQMKIDVSLEAVGPAAGTEVGRFLGLEAVIATAKSDKGSMVNPIQVDSATSPVAYDAAAMHRIQFGEFNDIAERRAGHFAWFTSSSRRQLCYDPLADEACVNFMDWSGLDTLCEEGDAASPAVCKDGLLKEGTVGRSVRFVLTRPYGDGYAARLQTHFGFINPNAEFIAPSSAPARLTGFGLVALFLIVFAVLL